MDSFQIGTLVNVLMENDAKKYDVNVTNVHYDENDGSVTVWVRDNGKTKRFLIEVKEV